MDFVRSFQQKNKITKIKIDTVGQMGREGEYTLALSLDELTAKQKAAFIKKIKKVCKLKDDPGQIQYEENVTVDGSKNPRAATPQTIKIE